MWNEITANMDWERIVSCNYYFYRSAFHARAGRKCVPGVLRIKLFLVSSNPSLPASFFDGIRLSRLDIHFVMMRFSSSRSMAGSKNKGLILNAPPPPPVSFEALSTNNFKQGRSFPLKLIKMTSDPPPRLFQISFLLEPSTGVLGLKESCAASSESPALLLTKSACLCKEGNNALLILANASTLGCHLCSHGCSCCINQRFL